MRYHFIAGLPRSGSTLLSAILRQNPRFHASISSPVGSLFATMRHHFSAGGEWGSVITQDKRRALVRGLFDSYYADLVDKEVVFDTNRSWCASMSALADLFPAAKVICCVRNVAWVMDSIERLYRADPYENTRLFGNDVERMTVYGRVEGLAQKDRLVGLAWTALKEAFYGEHASSLLVIEYDLLTKKPEQVIPLIYQFIGEEAYPHEYDNLEFDTPEFDINLGVRGLHKVRRKVEFLGRETVLPPDLFAKYSGLSFWNDAGAHNANILRMEPVSAVPAGSMG